MKVGCRVMLGEFPACLVICWLALALPGSTAGGVSAAASGVSATASGVSATGGACARGVTWWARERGTCLPCTRCEPARAVRFPCELHRDTICQNLHEVNINIYPFNTLNFNSNFNSSQSETVDSEYSDEYSDNYEEYNDNEISDSDGDGEAKWNVQATTLVLAASGCVVFFVVVLYFSFNHIKQWRVLKQALRSDVQDLSAKLKLMEAGETPAKTVVSTDHHIYCNIHVNKHDVLKGPASKKKGPGNEYTQQRQPV